MFDLYLLLLSPCQVLCEQLGQSNSTIYPQGTSNLEKRRQTSEQICCEAARSLSSGRSGSMETGEKGIPGMTGFGRMHGNVLAGERVPQTEAASAERRHLSSQANSPVWLEHRRLGLGGLGREGEAGKGDGTPQGQKWLLWNSLCFIMEGKGTQRDGKRGWSGGFAHSGSRWPSRLMGGISLAGGVRIKLRRSSRAEGQMAAL